MKNDANVEAPGRTPAGMRTTSLTYRVSDGRIDQQWYAPWGTVRQRTGELPTDHTFQGHRDPGWGLKHFGARWFDSHLGRFAQADSIIPGAGNPLAWDRYAGLGNNPVRYTDPTGHRPACEDTDDPACDEPLKRQVKPKNPIGRHLAEEEIRMLGVLAIGETSNWNDTGFLNWIIWGLLNKIAYEEVYHPRWSTYERIQNEESGLINGNLKLLAEKFKLNYSDNKEMLVLLADEYSSGRVIDGRTGNILSDEFEYVLSQVESIEAQWFLYGPGSSADPTNAGIGHVKANITTNMSEAETIRNATANNPNWKYTAVSPVYYADGTYRFIMMNSPTFVKWP